MKEVGRNDPCPCGSGKKYKKCCASKPPLKRRSFTQMPSPEAKGSIQRITGVLSQTLRKTDPEGLDQEVKKKMNPEDEDLDSKS
ncbi:MAG: SEC-C domain-containing protein [Chlamydiia bacterium]|nr:SEC-C domain-containing protein [Chlamydiia bacterium]